MDANAQTSLIAVEVAKPAEPLHQGDPTRFVPDAKKVTCIKITMTEPLSRNLSGPAVIEEPSSSRGDLISWGLHPFIFGPL